VAVSRASGSGTRIGMILNALEYWRSDLDPEALEAICKLLTEAHFIDSLMKAAQKRKSTIQFKVAAIHEYSLRLHQTH
jgi:hypothetical protein